jgi:hypothetical protein
MEEIIAPKAGFVPGAVIEAKLVEQFQKLISATSRLDFIFS